MAYQLKDMAYQWYEEWDQSRGEDVESSLWEDFSNAFLDCFFSQELREEKVVEVVNLNRESFRSRSMP